MTTTKPLRSFTKATKQLKHCSLNSPIAGEEALSLAIMLANSDPWLTLTISAKTLERYFIREDLGLRRYTVRIKDEIAGVICVRYPWLRGPYIELLGLAAQYRGLGIGKQLLAWAETEARYESKNLWVVASSFNHEALQFYQRQGFQPVGTLQGLICPNHDEILLRKCWD